LKDPQVIQQILSAINPGPDEIIVEIGPGQAALTAGLLAARPELHLLEIDRDLAESLRHRIAPYPTAFLHIGDALEMDLGEITGPRNFRLVGNLPYNISTPVIFHALQWAGHITDMHFMLQKEVVDRMAAGPGSKAWGRLSIMCQYHCRVIPLFTVAPEAFSPTPRVQSSLVRLVPHQQPPVELHNQQHFDQVVRQAFGQRRKTLRNSLRHLLDATRIEAAGIDPGRRPESLDMADFAALSRQIS
jgi:16S rRNA (adenine1518-N6/adenine1519-N6)-dimethyltransferase